MKSISMTPALQSYLLSMSPFETKELAALRAETAQLPQAIMQIPPEQGCLMNFLVRALGVRRALEVGVFTGYSALAVALALPDDGELTACDVSDTWTRIAQRYWQEAGVAHKIKLHLAPAADTLQGLLTRHAAGTYDFAFIDADKHNYLKYYELVLQLLRPGGVLVVDNVLWNGAVIDSAVQDVDTQTIRAINQKIAGDARVHACMLPLADGVTLARKK